MSGLGTVPSIAGALGAPPTLQRAHVATADTAWGFGGRRMVLAGGERTGLREASSHPFRLIADASVDFGLVDGDWRFEIRPDRVSRRLQGATRAASEVWTTALELPLLIWDIASEHGGIRASWSVALTGAASGGPTGLTTVISDDGRALSVHAAGIPASALFMTDGGTLAIEGAAGGVTRVRARGGAGLRIVGIGAADADDLARTLDLLGRRGVAGIARQRSAHAEQLARGGVAIADSADESAAVAFEWAKVEADATITDMPGVGRSLLIDAPAEGCQLGLGLLAAGLRDGPRDTLRYLARTQAPNGETRGASTRSFLHLASRYAAWTGDIALQEEIETATERAARFVAAGGGGIDREELHPSGVGAAAVLFAAAERRWGIEPDAPNGMVRIRPRAPSGIATASVSLSRLRVGRSVLDLRLRRRRSSVQMLIRLGAGPAITVDCEILGVAAHAVLLDGAELGSTRVRFEASAEHELVIHDAGG